MTNRATVRPAFRGAALVIALAAGSLIWTVTATGANAVGSSAGSSSSSVVPAVTTPPPTTPPATTPPTPKPRCKVKATMAVPRGKAAGSGKRIVYSEKRQHVWVLDKYGCTLRDYKVTGRADWPRAGSYKVFSKSRSTMSAKYHVTFNYMVRFAHGRTTSIGFHDIPKHNGRPIQSVKTLGQPLGLGGCVRAATPNAKWLYGWAGIGTRVYVVR